MIIKFMASVSVRSDSIAVEVVLESVIVRFVICLFVLIRPFSRDSVDEKDASLFKTDETASIPRVKVLIDVAILRGSIKPVGNQTFYCLDTSKPPLGCDQDQLFK